MKTSMNRTAGLLLAIMTIVSLAGCEELLSSLNTGTTDTSTVLSITERIAAFAIDINADDRTADDILENFGPENSMTFYGTAAQDSYWDIFPAAESQTFIVTDFSDPLNVVVTGTTSDSDGNLLTEPTYKFVMYQETSGNYLIQEIWEGEDYLIKKVKF